MAASDNARSRRELNRTSTAVESLPSTIAPRSSGLTRHSAPRRPHGRGKVGNVVVMSLAFGLMATMALPAYAFAPQAEDTAFAATDATERTKAEAQGLEVDAAAASVTVARDGFTATTPEEIAAAEAATAAAEAAAAAAVEAAAAEERRAAVSTQLASYATSYVGPSAAEYVSAPAYPDVNLGSVFDVASQYQGVPYVYGGSTPAGFDCSGFIMYVYAQFGVSLPHSSNGQAAAGTRIAIEDAVPGDLVIMPGHDGFYAGNGNILHAPYTGQNVRIQPIWTSDYYIVRIGI